ncbi:hypothetical protein MMC15_005662 [Xylographa vitiligo]|nr:hypothetical protein [Xylographa vitiligo]
MERNRASAAETALAAALEERDEALSTLDRTLARLDAANTETQNALGERDHAVAQLAAHRVRGTIDEETATAQGGARRRDGAGDRGVLEREMAERVGWMVEEMDERRTS